MKKTLFLSEATEDKTVNTAKYIFFAGGKWREDTWHFANREDITREAKKQGYLIK